MLGSLAALLHLQTQHRVLVNFTVRQKVMRPVVILLLSASIAVLGIAAGRPQFDLSPGESKGVLCWRSHTFALVGDELVPQADYVVEDPKGRTISVCLEWETEPDVSSGEFLAAFGAWVLPKAILDEKEYVLSVERHTANWVVFTLATRRGDIVLRSEPFPIAKGWRGSVAELGAHITPVPASALVEAAPSKPLHGTPAKSPSSSAEPEGRRP